ncbi:uncharacterized protein IL334_004044 [Kwoniella shivajii]|uniref:Uncharacterized protein n=1 Tax=Kwoniella shivajii TaxID=564305 RepID=A0ABZ1CZU8_9TREE|nr:hypothetical protein IL334_004044 [Kwoniella shivajii]
MARRRVPTRYHPKSKSPPSPLRTRLELLTYAFARLPPRQLPFLASYAYVIIYAAEKGWVDKESLGKGGASIVGVLSMVTGLLVSYRFSSAIQKWDEGRQVWASVRITIRDGMRMISIPPAASIHSPALNSQEGVPEDADKEIEPVKQMSSTGSSPSKEDKGKGKERRDPTTSRVDELAGLLVGFAFALQHHLHGTRPLPQPPLCDLLPSSYLASLKRTEARVRFAESHAGPSGSNSNSTSPSDNPSAKSVSPLLGSSSVVGEDGYRPGLRRRGTGPPTKEEKDLANEDGEWELSNLREKAQEAVNKLTEAITLSGLTNLIDEENSELKQQLNQLNLPLNEIDREQSFSHNGGVLTSSENQLGVVGSYSEDGKGIKMKSKSKSNLHSPNPPNLPLALLKLIEAYVVGLAGVDSEKGGWTDSKRERGLAIVHAMSNQLGEAERLLTNPPPLPLTLHLSHLLIIYLAALPCSLLCVVNGWSMILITVVAGWCLLGLEALIGEVGGVFGSSENHLPLPMFTQQILNESLDISPAFLRYYRSRLVSKLGENEEEVQELDRRSRRSECEWTPSFG